MPRPDPLHVGGSQISRTPSAPDHKQAGFSRLGDVYEAKWKVSESSTTDMVLSEPDVFPRRELRAAPVSSQRRWHTKKAVWWVEGVG